MTRHHLKRGTTYFTWDAILSCAITAHDGVAYLRQNCRLVEHEPKWLRKSPLADMSSPWCFPDHVEPLLPSRPPVHPCRDFRAAVPTSSQAESEEHQRTLAGTEICRKHNQDSWIVQLTPKLSESPKVRTQPIACNTRATTTGGHVIRATLRTNTCPIPKQSREMPSRKKTDTTDLLSEMENIQRSSKRARHRPLHEAVGFLVGRQVGVLPRFRWCLIV